MPHRSYASAANYRFGFNGKENDNEPKGLGNQQDYGKRIYDARLGRFLSIDPLQVKFTDLSSYHFTANNPINFIDTDGKDTFHFQERYLSFPQKEILDGIYLQSRGSKSQYGCVIISAPGPDVFYYEIIETVLEANGPSQNIRSKEFFPNSPWTKSGITESSGLFGIWDVDDPDFVSLAKLASPKLLDYLEKHNNTKYGGLRFVKEQYEEYEKITAISNVILLVSGIARSGFSLLNNSGIVAGFSVLNGVGGATREMSIVRLINKGEKLEDIINEGKALTFTTGNEHALVTLRNGQRAIVSGGPGGITFKKGQLQTLFGHTHPTSAPPSQADQDALKELNQTKQYVLHGGQVTVVKQK